jgi:hypothetical protein
MDDGKSTLTRYVLNLIDPVGFRFDIKEKKKKPYCRSTGGCRRAEEILKKSGSVYEVRGLFLLTQAATLHS